jgi:hypothetical protein
VELHPSLPSSEGEHEIESDKVAHSPWTQIWLPPHWLVSAQALSALLWHKAWLSEVSQYSPLEQSPLLEHQAWQYESRQSASPEQSKS